ncbi:DUF4357 domain-containing protein [Hymenobacter glacialis]|uniref:DUF4357 domain-containing protein n=1 Tax=Hymenobacter glacialis TaxID=1908236 RepID=A0A1G1SZ80_9BACT|nr:DUF4357 domain-containing protein [Hymenobacter glacialis]OGX83891.1 hypothetical protein BEN48_03790 [Hymenobacter glacialis]
MHEVLLDIRQRLLGKEYKNEEHVRLSLVARVVQALGWDIWNPTEVFTEFKATKKEDNTRVDMALFTPDFEATAIFIECKGVGAFATDLTAVERQLRDYNRDHTALFTIITDGRHWRFYFSFTSGEFKDKLFCKFDLQQDGLEEVAGYLETFLHRENILNRSARQKAEAYLMLGKKERAMQDVLPDAQKLVSMPPFPSLPEAMVQLLAAKILTITPAEAQAFLTGAPVTLVAGLSPKSLHHVDEKPVKVSKTAAYTNKVAPVIPKKLALEKSVAVPQAEAKRMPKVVASPTEFFLVLNRAGIKATADWSPVTQQLQVRTGSTAMLENRDSLPPSIAALRNKLLQQNILVRQNGCLEFQQEYLFDTIIQAAQVICGYSVNGKQAWRDLSGKPLADYVN